MKVALCLFGQPRFMDVSNVHIQYNDEIISRYGADVYAHAWKGSDAVLDVPSWSRNHGMTDPNLPADVEKSIREKYNPSRMIVDRARPMIPKNTGMVDYLGKKFQGNEFWSVNNLSNIISQCTSIADASFMAISKGPGGKTDWYDFYVLARYDTRLTGFPDLTKLDPNKSYLPEGGHWNDLIQIWSHNHVTHLWNLDTQIFQTDVYEKVLLPIPEFFKMEAFNTYFGPEEAQNVLRLPMYGHVIRKREDI